MVVSLLHVLAAAAAPMPPAVAPAEIVVVARERNAAFGMPLSNLALSRMRGGLRLPNGLDVSLGIDIQTRVDGLLALHTVYASEGPATGVRVFTDGAKPVPTAPATTTVSADAVAGVPVLVIDRSPTGTTIMPTSSVAATTVNLVNGDPSTWLSGEGQTQVPVTPNGPAVAAEPGSVRLTSDESGAVVTLQAPNLEIRHLVGQATGTFVANTGDNRSIDTISSVNVDVQGLSPALLSGIFAAQRAALAAVLARGF